jgi:alkanesulfonate monooxygenase SsuD/methylene tetrahydromethanopterin reductase-like flavin-dependent oxidoreductase (luciferase family)
MLTVLLAWNVVTSFSKSSAQALGMDNLASHEERYAAAEEYMDIVYSYVLESSESTPMAC